MCSCDATNSAVRLAHPDTAGIRTTFTILNILRSGLAQILSWMFGRIDCASRRRIDAMRNSAIIKLRRLKCVPQ